MIEDFRHRRIRYQAEIGGAFDMIARTPGFAPAGRLQIDFLPPEAKRHPLVTEFNAPHIQNPDIKRADRLYIAARNDKMIQPVEFKHDFSPVEPNSSHAWGRTFSRSYVRHLFNINEVLGLRIASTLNLSYYLDLMAAMRQQINEGNFDPWSKSLLSDMENQKGM